MEKTIQIGEKDVRLNNNIGWTFIYRDQFGQDIIPTLMPLLASILDLFAGAVKSVGRTDNLGMDDMADLIQSDMTMEALVKLSSLEFVDFINLTWALAKNADSSIQEPKIWVRQFDEFPVDVIAPELFRMVLSGVVSSKNLERLQNALRGLGPKSTSTPSSLPESNEG